MSSSRAWVETIVALFRAANHSTERTLTTTARNCNRLPVVRPLMGSAPDLRLPHEQSSDAGKRFSGQRARSHARIECGMERTARRGHFDLPQDREGRLHFRRAGRQGGTHDRPFSQYLVTLLPRRSDRGVGERAVRRVSVRVASSRARAVISASAKSIDAIYTLDWRCVEYPQSDLG